MAELYSETPQQPQDDTPKSAVDMVAITSLAASKVKEIREAEDIEADMLLRLRVVGGGCAGFSYDLYFDAPTEMDKKFSVHGIDVVVDQMSLMYLVGTEVDYVESLAGAGFKFNNPNVKATCGCGMSFSA
jgi:iron-sulfur cluster insertion protein